MSNNIDKRLSYLSNSEKQITRDVLIQLLKNSELINKNRQTRFVMKGGSKKENGYLHSLLPLTKMECRWLITVLEDPLAHIFLTDEQINTKINEFKEEIFNLRMQQATGNLEKPSRIKELRKTVARMKTILEERKETKES